MSEKGYMRVMGDRANAHVYMGKYVQEGGKHGDKVRSAPFPSIKEQPFAHNPGAPSELR